VDAQNKLGWRFHYGVGVPKSKRRAFHRGLRSAKQGFAKAHYNVGLAYQFERGVDRDYRKAAKWFREASDNEFIWRRNPLVTSIIKAEALNVLMRKR